MNALDLFAGPGGWDVGARELGIDPLGIESDDAACQTRAAAGLRTHQGDVAALDPHDFGPCDLLIASPPCQAWSMAGKRKGQEDIARVYALTSHIAYAYVALPTTEWADPRSKLVTEPLRWALALEPDLIAWEQVPPVLDYWKHCASILRERGYGTWAGILSAERYSVPQTRKRAILMAAKGRAVHPPAPTHQAYVPGEPAQHQHTLEGELLPWVSMATALGWTGAGVVNTRCDRQTPGGNEFPPTQPSWALTEKARSWTLRANAQDNSATRDSDEPAPTITGGHDTGDRVWTTERPATAVCADPRLSPPGYRGRPDDYDAEGNYNGERSMDNAVRVTIEEASILQSFAPNYPWDGLAAPPHIASGFSIKDDEAVYDEFVCDLRKRGVGFTVRLGGGEDDQILQAVVIADAVDVVDDLTRLRPGDLAVLRSVALAGDEDVARTVEPRAGCELRGAALVRVERITVEPPLLPVSGAPATGDGFAFTVLARLLRGAPGDPVPSVADALVVHEAHALRTVGPVATFDLAEAHVPSVRFRSAGNSRTKQFEQIGNAVPPPLARAVLESLAEIVRLREAA